MAKPMIKISAGLEYIDAPAQAVLDETARSVAKRAADETREELDRILKKVDNICEAYEYSHEFKNLTTDKSTNIEYVSDLVDLMNLLKDEVKKRQYMQQITVFIVGYERACASRLRIIQQVNEFLVDAEGTFENDFIRHEEDNKNIEYNEEHLAICVEESIASVRTLTDRLAEVNHEMVDFMVKYAQKKQGNRIQKKLEKALEQAKQECSNLNLKLAAAKEEVLEKDDRIQSLHKQMENKNAEITKYKIAAETLKKAINSDESNKQKDEEILQLQMQIDKLTVDLAEAKVYKDLREEEIREQEEKLAAFEKSKVTAEHVVRRDSEDEENLKEQLEELKRQYDQEMERLKSEHQIELDSVKAQYEEIIEAKGNDVGDEDLMASNYFHDDFDTSERIKHLSRGSTIVETKLGRETSKITSDSENVNFNDAYALDDEESWSNVPSAQIRSRFKQYRNLANDERRNLMDQLEKQQSKHLKERKELRIRFHDQRQQWISERDLFLSRIKKIESERQEAQNWAEKAVGKMEEMIEITENSRKSNANADEERDLLWKAKLEVLESENNYLKERLAEIPAEPAEVKEQLDPSRKSSVDEPPLTTYREFAIQVQEALHFTSVNSASIQAEISLIKSMTPPREFEDEDDDDMKMPVESEDKSIHADDVSQLAEHPIVQEYLFTYQLALQFRVKILKLLEETSSPLETLQALKDYKPFVFLKENRITPQCRDITKSMDILLTQTLLLLQEMIRALNESASASAAMHDLVRDREDLREQLNIMQEKHKQLKMMMEESNSKYELQINHNTKLMLEMQDTIRDLRRELTDLQETVKKGDINRESTATQPTSMHVRSQSNLDFRMEPVRENVHHHHNQQHPGFNTEIKDIEAPLIHFTRTQSERNATTLKRAYQENRISAFVFNDALKKMEEYTKVPTERLATLIRKYLSMQTMQRLAEYIRQNRPLNKHVFKMLDQVEEIIEKRDNRYRAIMDFWREQRLIKAQNMIDTLETIETGSSIFLIKPVVNFEAREVLRSYYETLLEQRLKNPLEDKATVLKKKKISFQPRPIESSRSQIKSGKTNENVIIGRKAKAANQEQFETVTLWQPNGSMPVKSDSLYDQLGMINTPKLLEMDINRYLMSQTNASVNLATVGNEETKLSQTPVPVRFALPAWESEISDFSVKGNSGINNNNNSRPRYNSSQTTDDLPSTDTIFAPNAVRHYIALNRPNSNPIHQNTTLLNEKNKAPPCTPFDNTLPLTPALIKSAKLRGSKDLTGSLPLPPIINQGMIVDNDNENNEFIRIDDNKSTETITRQKSLVSSTNSQSFYSATPEIKGE